MKKSFLLTKDEIREICLNSQKLFQEWKIPECTAQDMVLAIDEALTNILEHGYPQTGKNHGEITLEIFFDNSRVRIRIEDQAGPYSLEAPLYPDKQAYLNSRICGGFGLSLIKKLMDFVQVNRVKNYNILEMMKNVLINNKVHSIDNSGKISTKTIDASVENGILMVVAKPGTSINLEDARENLDAYFTLIETFPQKQVYAKVIDQRSLKEMSMEARKYHILGEPTHIRALALIDNSRFTRWKINIFSFSLTRYRAVRMFKNKPSAVRWASQFSN